MELPRTVRAFAGADLNWRTLRMQPGRSICAGAICLDAHGKTVLIKPLALVWGRGWMAGSETKLLFVYGTLLQHSSHPMAARLKRQSQYLGPGIIAAKLYDLGSYPGAVPSDKRQDRVRGDVVKLLNPVATFPWLDKYEGCGIDCPEPHDYERVITSVAMTTGERLHAWVYFYVMPVHRVRHIPHGRYSRS